MSLFKLINIFKVKNTPTEPEEETVIMWENDYLQVEILPSENRAFLKEKLRITRSFAETHKTEDGLFTDVMALKEIPSPTGKQEFRADTLESSLLEDGLPQYKTIEYYEDELPRLLGNNTKAFGFKAFVLFFETDGEFVKNIWTVITKPVPAAQRKTLVYALYDLGESYDLLLVDWNTDELVDLKNMQQIRAYLA